MEKALNLQSKSYENNAFITSYKVLLLLTINPRGRTVLSACGSVYHMIQDESVQDSETVHTKTTDHSAARGL